MTQKLSLSGQYSEWPCKNFQDNLVNKLVTPAPAFMVPKLVEVNDGKQKNVHLILHQYRPLSESKYKLYVLTWVIFNQWLLSVRKQDEISASRGKEKFCKLKYVDINAQWKRRLHHAIQELQYWIGNRPFKVMPTPLVSDSQELTLPFTEQAGDEATFDRNPV